MKIIILTILILTTISCSTITKTQKNDFPRTFDEAEHYTDTIFQLGRVTSNDQVLVNSIPR